MVICPWCGSNYIAFQTSCSRCGGPIPAPASPAAPVNAEEVTLPPPPPRPISDGYRWKLMRTDAWCVGAAIFALMGVIFAVVGFALTVPLVTAFVGLPFLGLGLLFLGGGGGVLYWRHQEAVKSVNILRHGEAVIGQVTQAQPNTSVSVNGRNPLVITYRFRAAGSDQQGTITTLNPLNLEYLPGQAICVLYLPGAPEYSSLYPHP